MMLSSLPPDLAAQIQEIAAHLATQDNRATDCPIFIVQEKRRADSDSLSGHVGVRDGLFH